MEKMSKYNIEMLYIFNIPSLNQAFCSISCVVQIFILFLANLLVFQVLLGALYYRYLIT